MPNRLLVHVLFHRHLGQRSSIIALMTADPPFLEPLLLNVGLSTFGTNKDALLVENHPLFFHRSSLSAESLDKSVAGWHRVSSDCKRVDPLLRFSLIFLVRLSLLEFFLHQHTPEHFTYQCLRKLASKLHFLGNLELGEFLPTMFQNLCSGGGLAVL